VSTPSESGPPEPFGSALAEAEHVLFLCSGNMVRSTFAELFARHCALAVPTSSAATRFRNEGMYRETRVALRDRGVPEEWIRAFRSRHLDEVWRALPARTLVLGMTSTHLAALAPTRLQPARAFLLGSVLGEPAEIPDPVLEGAEFGATFARLEACVRALVERYGSVTSTRR